MARQKVKQKKVILIDDMRELSWIQDPDSDEQTYATSGCNVTICRSIEEGLDKLRSMTFDVLLLDHDMGFGPTGSDVLKFLEENPQHMPKSIYLVTANIIAGRSMMNTIQDWFKQGKILKYNWIRN